MHNAIRALGGVFGVAVLAAIFSHSGGYASGEVFVDGLTPALWVGAAVVALGSLAAWAMGPSLPSSDHAELVPDPQPI